MAKIDVYLEKGKKRTFAGAVDWPGWCLSGRDENSALEALFDYGARYARAIQPARLGFRAPEDLSALKVVERLEGNSTTDFGAPAVAPSADARPAGEQDLRRFLALLEAVWRAFDEARRAAAGKELRKGPRGGGRDLERIASHVQGADAGYLNQLGWKLEKAANETSLEQELERTRQAIRAALPAAVSGELPAVGPRGGLRWPPRYYVRRSAWHVLDHAWEIEDRVEQSDE